MKKISFLILTIVCILLLFCSCNRADATEGLTYRLQDDGTYYVSAGEGTSQLSEIVIPMWHNGRLVKGISLFSGNRNLEYLYIPSSVKVIESGAFSYCESLSTIEFAGGLEEIGNFAFTGCASLTEIKLTDSLKSIGKEAFADCTSLERVDMSNSRVHILPMAFKNCTSLSDLKLSERTVEISDEAFFGCSSLTSLRIPKSVSSLGKHITYGCNSITRLELLGPEIIPSEAFYKLESLTEVYFGDSVKRIGNNFSYEYNRKLSKVRMSSNIEYIEPLAFANVSLLNFAYTDFGGGRYIGNEKNPYIYLARKTVVATDNIEIHPDCRVVCADVIYGIADPILPDGIVSVPSFIVSPKEYDLYNNYIGCIYLGTADNPYHMLVRCHGIGDLIQVHPDCEIISGSAFSSVSPSRLYIPSKVRSFGGQALGNSNISRFEVDPANKYFKSVDGMLLSKDGRTLLRVAPAASGSITLPKGVTTIGDYALSGCKNVDQVFIPSGVKTVGRNAFEGCVKLEKIHIPASLKTIGEGAFKNSGLKWVVYGGSDEKFKNIELYCGNDRIKYVELKDE